MKKVGIALVLSMMLLCGCDSKEQVLTCTRTVNQGDTKTELSYKVTHDGTYVKQVDSTEKVTSDSDALLQQYKTQIEALYEGYSDLDHYSNTVTIDGNTLTSKTIIDYDQIDTDKMIEIDSANANIIKDGKVQVSDLQSMYESLGTTCTNE